MKIRLKYSLLLLLSIAITEFANGIILFCFVDRMTVIFAMIFVSLFLYFILGKIFISKLTDKESLRKSVLYVSIVIILSYMVSIILTEITGQYYIIHMEICSPIANLMVMPFDLIKMSDEIAILLNALFAPVNVVLIWLFSKIKTRKKSDSKEAE